MAAPQAARWLRTAVLAVAIIELLGSLSDLAVIANLPEEDRSPAHWLVFADVALQPLLALVAAYHAFAGKLRIAIMALAAMAVIELLLRNIPLMGPGGLEDSAYGLVLFVQTYVLPVLCVVALWLAWQNRRLELAGAGDAADLGGHPRRDRLRHRRRHLRILRRSARAAGSHLLGDADRPPPRRGLHEISSAG